jgi:hypothetical protein
MSEQQNVDLLKALIEKRRQASAALQQVAGQQATGQPWRTAGDTRSKLDAMMGRGATPAQNRAMNQIYTSMLNRKPGQTHIGAATQGFERGGQLIDEIREKQRNASLQAAQVGVSNADADIKDHLQLQTNNYNNASIRQRDARLALDRDKLKFDKNREQWDRDNPTMSVTTEKKYNEVVDTYNSSSANSRKFTELADNLEEAGYMGGALTWTGETLKQFLGTEDEQSALIREGRRVSVKEAIESLPPGVASDKDIELVMSTVPGRFSDPQYLADYLRARAKFESWAAEYAEFTADYMERNKTRRFTTMGVNSAWRAHKMPAETKTKIMENADNPRAVKAMEEAFGKRTVDIILGKAE